jgi:hypothetical protein
MAKPRVNRTGLAQHGWMGSCERLMSPTDLGTCMTSCQAGRFGQLVELPAQDLVHELGPCSKHRPQLPSVHNLGGAGAGVAGNAGDLLDRYA